MWDNECETKAQELLSGFVGDADSPPLEEQQEVATRLNRMLPYPGWRFKLVSSGDYWVVANKQLRCEVAYDAASYFLTRVDDYADIEEETDTLMEMITQLELGL